MFYPAPGYACRVKFRDLAEHMQAVEATASRLQMGQLLSDLLSQATPEETPPIAYMLLGHLAPDHEGLEVGLAEKMVRRLIRDRTGASADRIRSLLADTGDLGLVAETLWQEPRGGQLALDAFGQQTLDEDDAMTVLEVHTRLSEIARISGSGSQETKLGHAWRLLDQASPLEARYLIRFLVGKLRLGVADMTLLDGAALAYAPAEALAWGDDDLPRPPTAWREAMERAYNLTSDIGATLLLAREEGLPALEAVAITPGEPVRPMLAERLSEPAEIFEKVGSPALAELKYDGLRMQAHKAGEDVQLFSRRLEAVTEPYPDIVRSLLRVFDGHDVVVEGEAVPVDRETGKLREFQAIARRRGRKHGLQRAIEEVPIHLYLFDLLYLDGQDLTTQPLEERRGHLASLLADDEAVHLSDGRRIEDPGGLEAFFEEAMARNAEGVMVKQLGEGSTYQAGARGWRWVKFKADYREDLADALDLVIVGAYHGRGRRAGWYGTLLGAAWDADEARYKTVCKIGTGFTDEDLEALDDRLGDHATDTCPKQVDCELEPDIYFEPEVVAEIHGAELTRSPVHTAAQDEEGGIALRFPRFIGWREDKGPQDATTVEEIRAMYARQFEEPGEAPGTAAQPPADAD